MGVFNLDSQTFKSTREITYHFIPAIDELHSKELLVVFSALNKPNVFRYNYISSLKDVPINKLFILDNFGDQGSYYIGENRDFSIETSVISLILNIASKLNVNLNKISTMGSSKGGYSALYYSIKYSFGSVLALSPTTLLGNSLRRSHPNILKYIAGGDSEEDVQYLNKLLFELVQNKRDSLPKIDLMVGTMDSHKNRHVDPFAKHLQECGVDFEYDLVEGVNHSELKDFAPGYIQRYYSEKYNLKLVETIN